MEDLIAYCNKYFTKKIPRDVDSPWWRHQMETFSALMTLCAGIHRAPVTSPLKGQWRGALMFSLICAWISGWANDREAGDLRRHCANFDDAAMRRSEIPNVIWTRKTCCNCCVYHHWHWCIRNILPRITYLNLSLATPQINNYFMTLSYSQNILTVWTLEKQNSMKYQSNWNVFWQKKRSSAKYWPVCRNIQQKIETCGIGTNDSNSSHNLRNMLWNGKLGLGYLLPYKAKMVLSGANRLLICKLLLVPKVP